MCSEDEAIEAEHHKLNRLIEQDITATRRIEALTAEREQVRQRLRESQHYFQVLDDGTLELGLGCF